ncbi:hypothetical protein PPACK8108_LOCUS11973 [Phakopsora pachyrhizi]|uniref:Uncharacterized protein n=1 Tax=Phakopsora pachyrhizi TaxID=170000 RepID=A0AAV0B1I3_PHAPC|nr:hypothetical protein PPACK8108_LOCUS11973 [Phakopsora pachyrhizi]
MLGYNGIEILVNKALLKVMEQVDGCDLILNKGDKEKTKSKHSSNKEGRLLSNEGLDEDEERLDWVLKVLERYQITLEKVGVEVYIASVPATASIQSRANKLQEFIKKHLSKKKNQSDRPLDGLD